MLKGLYHRNSFIKCNYKVQYNNILYFTTDHANKRKKSLIYTKTGDKGTTSLYNGERRPKNDLTFEALGNQDELNAVIGIAREHCLISSNGLEKMLEEIQSTLFDVGAAIATPMDNSTIEKLNYVKFSPKYTVKLEEWIDEIDSKLPPLKNFVIPSGGITSCYINLARTICRRTERSVIALIQSEQVDHEVGIYLNRLSDFLFVASRMSALVDGKSEILWKKVH
eukprot:gene18984-24797_t